MGEDSFPTFLYNALTLRERLVMQQGNSEVSSANTSTIALAAKRLKRWQEQPSFTNSALFEQRLTQDGLNDKSFAHILGRTEGDYAADMTTPPRWVEQLTQLLGDSVYPADGRPDNEATADGFLTAFAPLIAAARTRLRQALAELLTRFPAHPVADLLALEAMLYDTVHPALKKMATPTLVLELNVARLRGELAGETPEERFAVYARQLSRPETVRPLITEYPVLFRLAAERLELWQHVSLELVERLCNDWEAIYDTFATGQQPTPLTRLSGAQGSTKRGGRSVIIFEFASGLRVVYKPRSLALERHFQELLLWLNQEGYEPDFRLLTLLDYETYGWVEWLEAAECKTEAELQRFYQRQGAYLALLYALEATDFHLKNVIAAGEYPLLIDLEALFHPRDAVPDSHPLELALNNATYHSVLRLGLLPEPELGEDETLAPVDQSGLGGMAGQLTPDASPTWEDRGKDTMHLVHKRRVLKGGKNLPVLNGRPANAVDYRQAIDEGFTTMYRLLIQKREALLAPDGPLARFAADEVRVLPRSGQTYGTLLAQSFHPDLMRDALDRDRFLDQLWKDVEDEPYLAHLIPYEQADLLIGDIPLFATRAASRNAYSSSGRPIPDFFPQSGLESAQQRIIALDETDLQHQRWFIHASLATVAEEQWSTGNGQRSIINEQPVKGELLDEARRIGERLEALALHGAGEAAWIGLEMGGGGHWEIEWSDTDLFDGLPGITLFLAYLGKLTGEERWTVLARSAVAAFLRYLADVYEGEELDVLSPIGAFNGLGGQLYALAHLGVLWQDERLIQAAKRYVEIAELLLEEIAEDEDVGLADGLAGCLAGLLAVHQVAPSPRTLEVAQRAGDELLICLQSNEGSTTVDVSGSPFDHFLSGRAGTAWTLRQLAAISGQKRYVAALADVLDDSTDIAPGLLVARVRMLSWISDVEYRERLSGSLRIALPAALEEGLGGNHSLGYGDMGYLDLLLQAAVALDDAGLRRLCGDVAAAVLAGAQENGWRFGTPLNVETPGLMTGLAGIGYMLLRLAAPEHVPSVLGLEMPEGRSQ